MIDTLRLGRCPVTEIAGISEADFNLWLETRRLLRSEYSIFARPTVKQRQVELRHLVCWTPAARLEALQITHEQD